MILELLPNPSDKKQRPNNLTQNPIIFLLVESRKIAVSVSIRRIENKSRRWSPEYDEVGRGA